jgi:hypothetical protein
MDRPRTNRECCRSFFCFPDAKSAFAYAMAVDAFCNTRSPRDDYRAIQAQAIAFAAQKTRLSRWKNQFESE